MVMPPDGPGDEVDCPACARKCVVPSRSSQRVLMMGLVAITLAIPCLLVTIVKLVKRPTVIVQQGAQISLTDEMMATESPPEKAPSVMDLYGQNGTSVLAMLGRPKGKVVQGAFEAWIYEEYEIDIVDERVDAIRPR